MKKIWLATMSFLVLLAAADTFYPGLFGTVVKIAEDDTLSVRKKPDYRSEKIAELPLYARVGIDRCIKVKRSTWCMVHTVNCNMGQELEYGDKLPGWVNARYLDFSNRGYVAVNDGHHNCNYALSCSKGVCQVVTDTTFKGAEVRALKTKSYSRKTLKGIGELDISVQTDEADAETGYPCGRLSFKIETFLQKQQKTMLLNAQNDPLQKKLLEVVSSLNEGDMKTFADYLHPKKEIIMTWSVHFGGNGEDIAFSQNDILDSEKNRKKKIHWGYTYGKGDEVRMSLYDYIAKLTKPLASISKIEKLKTLKGFSCPSNTECKGYEVFWEEKSSKTPKFDWQGLVIIFEKYHGRWYVTGLFRDRWTI